jgi:hypothetical protein
MRVKRWRRAGDSMTEAEARANIRDATELYLAPDDIELPEHAWRLDVTVG